MKECTILRDDYLECLHHRKEVSYYTVSYYIILYFLFIKIYLC